jgi:uncharacterized RDD family membrane protein YckC
MAKLIVNPSSSQKREILLPRTLLSIGRDPSNDLVLPDAMVSRRHAVVEWRGSQFYLRDCNSSNGSLVNGDRISEKGLRDGDLVAIGTARLLFRDDAASGDDVGAKVVQHPSARSLLCPSCSADYRKGDLFCRQCGGSLVPAPPAKLTCTACGTAVALPAKFCNACGTPLPASAAAAPPASAAPMPAGPLPATSGKASPAPALMAPMPEEEPEVVSEMELRPPSPAPFPAIDPKPEDPEARFAHAPLRIPPSRSSTAAKLRVVPARVPVLPPPVPAAPEPPQDEPAGAGARLLAALVDFAIVGALQSLLLVPVAAYWWGRELPAEPSQVGLAPILLSFGAVPAALLLGALFFVWGWGVRGGTPGKKLLGLVVTGEDGRAPIGAGRAALRLFGYAVSALVLGLGFLLVALAGEGLHDKIAGTRVVRREDA